MMQAMNATEFTSTACLHLFSFPLLFSSPYSIPFIYPQIQLPTVGHDSSSSDSSDFSSEDDSTVVLMKTRSRSPSPRKSKHRSHRSGSHGRSLSRSGSPTQAKMKEPKVTDGSPSSTTVTAESGSTVRPAEGSSSQSSAPGVKDKDSEESGVWYTIKSCCCHRSHSQMLCLSFDTSTALYVFCNENEQFLMPSFSGTAIWVIQKAYFALSCFIKLCTLYIFYL